MEFETLQDMMDFYQKNSDLYTVTFGATARLYEKTPKGFPGKFITEVDDPRCTAIAMQLLKSQFNNT